MSPSRSGSFRFGGTLPPHLRVLPSSMAASMAFWRRSSVALSVLRTRQETEYFSSLPLIDLGSQMLAKLIRQGMTTFVAAKF